MLYKVLLLLPQLSMISSSLVVDSTAQKSIYVTDYCPKMKFCPEGGHVMCMYYNAKSKMGPRCSNPQNISVTPELANKLLDVSNAVRSRISQGKEKGKNGDMLPRGYGIFRLNWDTELATFAQVLANQCVLRHDLCRATSRFPDPGQTAGLVRFSYPDWFPVSKSGNFTTPGMSQAKLMYATTQILKSWYGQKNAVTPNMITYYPDWTLNPSIQNGRLYLEMIYGSATHMGCGISAYTEYAYYDNNAALNYNSVQIICNYSARPRKGTAVYNTVPPGDTAEPFSRCGCPVGSEADDDCLCHEIKRQPQSPPMQLKQEIRQCPDGQVCDPTVVVLPIFTVEDAPPEKLITRESFTNTSLRKPMDDRIFQKERNDHFYSKRNFVPNQIMDKPPTYSSNGGTSQRQSLLKQNIRPMSHHQEIAIKNRYYDKKHEEMKLQESHSQAHVGRKKTSLFSRAAKFELPGSRSMRPMKPAGIKDVVPRKDFSNAKQLVNKYLYRSNDLIKPQYKKDITDEQKRTINEQALEQRKTTRADLRRNNNLNKPLFKDIYEKKPAFNKHGLPNIDEHETLKNIIESDHHLHDVLNILNATKPFEVNKEITQYQKIQKLTTESVLDTAEQKLITQDVFLKQIVSNTNDFNKPMNSVTEESDNKLMALLDTLEQEIKHVELRDRDRQLFDVKIRKIYGKVVGKPVNLINLTINKQTDSKTRRIHLVDDVKDSYVMQKSIQQDPTEEPFYEKSKMKKGGPDELNDREMETNYKKSYRNSSTTRDRYEMDKYDERNVYKDKYSLRGMKHSDQSYEEWRSRYLDYDHDHEYGGRKTYRNNDFDRNTLGDIEPRHRGADNKYRNRNNDRDRQHRDEIEHRIANELEHRGTQLERHHRNGEIDQVVRSKNYYMSNDPGNDDPLSVERRRFYQEKLENIERRLRMRNRNRKKDKSRHMRPMRPASRKSESQMDIYGRARYAHGY